MGDSEWSPHRNGTFGTNLHGRVGFIMYAAAGVFRPTKTFFFLGRVCDVRVFVSAFRSPRRARVARHTPT